MLVHAGLRGLEKALVWVEGRVALQCSRGTSSSGALWPLFAAMTLVARYSYIINISSVPEQLIMHN